jgi:ribosomal silencing factor RsfS
MVLGTSTAGESSTRDAMHMDHITPCPWYVIQLHDRVVHVLEESMLEAGAA